MSAALALTPSSWPHAVQDHVLLCLRIIPVFALTPVWLAMPVPGLVRVWLLLALTVAVAAGLPSSAGSMPMDLGTFMQATCTELALGATLGLGVLLAFAAFGLAGSLLDAQTGLGMAQILDPGSRRPVSLLSTALTTSGVVVFFLVNGHHALLRGIAYSVEIFPPGRPWNLQAAMRPVAAQVASVFGLGFALAAPVVFCVLLVELALGVVARNLPQVNMLTLSIPVKIVVGTVALAAWFAAGIGAAMQRVYASLHAGWLDLFSATAQGVR